MQEFRIKIGEGGRLVIPAAYREAMDVRVGDELVLRMHEGELRIFRQAEALKKIRAAVKMTKRKSGRVDDFLAFRRKDSGE